MLGPVIELLNCKPGGIYVDGTVGGGGYARSILEKSAAEGVVLGMDWDWEAIERVRERLGGYGERLILEKADFADIRRVLRKHGIMEVDGIAVDLGVSSFQIEDPQRGFSFMKEGPLDMRMDRELASNGGRSCQYAAGKGTCRPDSPVRRGEAVEKDRARNCGGKAKGPNCKHAGTWPN